MSQLPTLYVDKKVKISRTKYWSGAQGLPIIYLLNIFQIPQHQAQLPQQEAQLPHQPIKQAQQPAQVLQQPARLPQLAAQLVNIFQLLY